MRLHCKTWGQGPPVIILHGMFGSLDNWSSIAAALAADFQVFAVDQRNHGRSPRAPDMNYELLAADLGEFIADRQLPPPILVGHSMGGKTAMQYALSHPEGVKKLVVADMAPKAYPARHEVILRALLRLDLTQFKSRAEMEEWLAPDLPDLAVRRFLLKSLDFIPGEGFRWRLGLNEINRNHEALRRAITGPGRFAGPALFIRGERSDYLRAADLAEIQLLFPAAEMRLVKNAGHWLHAENRAGFLAALEPFLHA